MKWYLNGVFVMKWGWVNGRFFLVFLVNYFFKITDHRDIVCPMLCFYLFRFESKLRSFFCNSTSMLLVCACVLPSSLLALCFSCLLLQNWRSGEWEVLLCVWVACVRQSITGVCLRVLSGQWCRAWYCFGDAGQSAVMTWCYRLSSCSYYTAYGESMFVFACSVCSFTFMH